MSNFTEYEWFDEHILRKDEIIAECEGLLLWSLYHNQG
jgi:hypothetical protein